MSLCLTFGPFPLITFCLLHFLGFCFSSHPRVCGNPHLGSYQRLNSLFHTTLASHDNLNTGVCSKHLWQRYDTHGRLFPYYDNFVPCARLVNLCVVVYRTAVDRRTGRECSILSSCTMTFSLALSQCTLPILHVRNFYPHRCCCSSLFTPAVCGGRISTIFMLNDLAVWYLFFYWPLFSGREYGIFTTDNKKDRISPSSFPCVRHDMIIVCWAIGTWVIVWV